MRIPARIIRFIKTSSNNVPMVSVMHITDPVKGFIYLFKTGFIAQALGFISIPVIIYKYDPESFGSFTIVISIATLIGVVSSLRIERAIVVEDETKLLKLFVYCFLLIVTSALLALLIILAVQYFQEVAENNTRFSALIGSIYCFLTGLTQLLSHLAIREKRIPVIGMSELVFSITLLGLLLGFDPGDNGSTTLLVIYAVSKLTSLTIYYQLDYKKMFLLPSKVVVPFSDLTRYIHSVFTTILSNLQFRGMYYLTGLYYGSSATGNIALAHRVMYSPVNLIGTALRRAYFGEFVKSGDIDNRIKQHVSNVLIYGTTFSLVLYPVIFFTASRLIELLPDDWVSLPKYITILYPSASILLLLSWLDRVYDAKKKQAVALSYEAVYTVVLYILLLIQLFYSGVFAFIATYTVFTVLYNIIWAYLTLGLLNIKQISVLILGAGHIVMVIFMLLGM